MRTQIVAIVLISLTTVASAQEDLLACLDPDVRQGLLIGLTDPAALVTRTVPDELAGLPQSDDIEFIGSSVSGFQTNAAYKSALTTSDAAETVTAMLLDTGWTELSMGGPPSGGFVTAERSLSGMFCRESSMLNLLGRPVADSSFVHLIVMPNMMVTQNGGRASCEEFAAPQGRGFVGTNGFATVYEYMPTLTLPEGVTPLVPRSATIRTPGFSTGSPLSASTEVQVETDGSAQDLVEQFGQQLVDQGWVLDNRWDGDYSSGSTWTRSPTEELHLFGLLDIISLVESGYRASFRASTREPQ